MTYDLKLKSPVSLTDLRDAAVMQAMRMHGDGAVFTDGVMDGLMFNVLKHDFMLIDGAPYDVWLERNKWTPAYKSLAEQLPDFVRDNGFAFLWRVAKSRAGRKEYVGH